MNCNNFGLHMKFVNCFCVCGLSTTCVCSINSNDRSLRALQSLESSAAG